MSISSDDADLYYADEPAGIDGARLQEKAVKGTVRKVNVVLDTA